MVLFDKCFIFLFLFSLIHRMIKPNMIRCHQNRVKNVNCLVHFRVVGILTNANIAVEGFCSQTRGIYGITLCIVSWRSPVRWREERDTTTTMKRKKKLLLEPFQQTEYSAASQMQVLENNQTNEFRCVFCHFYLIFISFSFIFHTFFFLLLHAAVLGYYYVIFN